MACARRCVLREQLHNELLIQNSVRSHRTHTKRLLLLHNQLANSTSKYIYTPPTATTMDSVKSTINDKMALLRSKLDQIPALQEVEVSLQRHYVMYK
jgi:hypothetical protein